MADLKPSTAPSASTLDGTELVPCTQGGTSKALTPSQIRTLIETLLSVLNVDNIKLDGNTISITNSNGGLLVQLNGTGKLQIGVVSANGQLIQLGGTSANFPGIYLYNTGAGAYRFDVNKSDDSSMYTVGADTLELRSTHAGNAPMRIGSNGRIEVPSNGTIDFSNTSGDGTATKTLGIKRDADGVLLVTDGGSGVGACLAARLVEASLAGSGTPNLLLVTESRKLITNTGATAECYNTLPASAPLGTEIPFYCDDTDGIRITAQAGETIRIEANVSASGGFIRSVAVGSGILLTKVATDKWACLQKPSGTWTIDV
jgi:hypothetical protein